MGESTSHMHSYDGTSWNPLDLGGNNIFASSLPTQVYKIFGNNSIIQPNYVRTIGRKNYELKDHLGNVSMVLTDEKIYRPATTTDDLALNDELLPEIISPQ